MTNTSSNASLGSRIRSLRLKRGLTQADLAERARISTVYVRSLESGARPWPSWPVLTRLFAALGVRVLLKFVRQEEAPHGR